MSSAQARHDLIGLGLGSLMFLAGQLWLIPRLWRYSKDEASAFLESVTRIALAPKWLIRGTMRSLPVLCAAWLGTGVLFGISQYMYPERALRPQAVLWGLRLVGSVLLVSHLVAISICLFNRPRFLVPPGMRECDGLLTSWLRRLGW